MPDELLARAALLGTATISDALDRLGFRGQCRGIAAIAPGMSLRGRAFTVRYRESDGRGTTGDYLDDVPPRAVIVLANGGRMDCSVWGDILTEFAHRRGMAGTVIDGICRDVSLAQGLRYPIFSRGVWMRTGKGRVEMDCTQCEVAIGEARVAPGDLLLGDGDGVLVIPQALEARVLEAAEQIRDAEDRIRVAVRAGLSLAEARLAHGYHDLQRPR